MYFIALVNHSMFYTIKKNICKKCEHKLHWEWNSYAFLFHLRVFETVGISTDFKRLANFSI